MERKLNKKRYYSMSKQKATPNFMHLLLFSNICNSKMHILHNLDLIAGANDSDLRINQKKECEKILKENTSFILIRRMASRLYLKLTKVKII